MKKIKFVIFLSFFITFFQTSFSQKIEIDVENEPLQNVFFELKDSHNIQFAYNSDIIKNCYITKTAIYNSPEEAIKALTQDCNLSNKLQGEIFIITQNSDKEEIKPKIIYTFSGEIYDPKSGETLPSAVIRCENKILTTDETGTFYIKSDKKILEISVSYLGFLSKDTTIKHSNFSKISIETVENEIESVTVKSQNEISDIYVGENAGEIKLNHKVTSFLPGNTDNGIYNLLRLQAGIMAAGEQQNDYTIWGSYSGQTLIIFDNIKLFNISSFDDNISIVPSQIIKEIEVYKGGFNAEYSNRVGGIVKKIGKNGNKKKFSGNINANNQTVSAYLNIPIAKRFALQTTFRQTFYNFLKLQFEKEGKTGEEYYEPQLHFRDFNFKFSGNFNEKDNFSVNFLSSNDNLFFDIDEDEKRYEETNYQGYNQIGASFLLNKHFGSSGYANTVFSYSQLETDIENFFRFESEEVHENYEINHFLKNKISEFTAKSSYFFPAWGVNKFETGVEFSQNGFSLRKNTETSDFEESFGSLQRASFYIKNHISLSEKFYFQPGIRTDFPFGINKIYVQPRINSSLELTKNAKLNFTYGFYNQFITKSTVVDEIGNFIYIWELANNSEIPVLSSHHLTVGTRLNQKYFDVNFDAFFKKVNNISQYDYNNDWTLARSFRNSRIAGVDLFFKAKIRKHEFWASYTFSQSLESSKTTVNQLAPHHQLHEIKFAGVLNFSPFYISANYVYGSGLEFTKGLKNNRPIPYSRLDFAVLYKLKIKKSKIDFGISILNLLNTYNIRYNNIVDLPDNELIYSLATPFTPTFNINIKF